jgi:hypothetical protein
MLGIFSIVSTLTIGLYYNTEANEDNAALYFLLVSILAINSYFLLTWALKFLDGNLGKIIKKVKKLNAKVEARLEKKLLLAQTATNKYRDAY